jgi:hypothetical protein
VWELGSPRRVAYYTGADSMLRFRLKREGDGMKHHWKMKRRQRARFSSIGRRCDNVAMSASGEATPERRKGGDDANWVDVNLTKPKNKENLRDQFSCFKWTVEI